MKNHLLAEKLLQLPAVAFPAYCPANTKSLRNKPHQSTGITYNIVNSHGSTGTETANGIEQNYGFTVETVLAANLIKKKKLQPNPNDVALAFRHVLKKQYWDQPKLNRAHPYIDPFCSSFVMFYNSSKIFGGLAKGRFTVFTAADLVRVV